MSVVSFIFASSGIIRLVSKLDYETASRYVLLLEVLDTETGLTARAELAINVTVS